MSNCGRYAYRSMTDARAEAERQNEGRPPEERMHAERCASCGCVHLGRRTGIKSIRARVRTSHKARRRAKK